MAARARAWSLATMAVLLLVLATQMITLNVGCRHRQISALALLEEHENRSGFPFRAPERGSLAFWLRACIRRIGLLRSAAIPAKGLGSGRGILKCKALIEGGRHVGGVLVGLYSCWEDSIWEFANHQLGDTDARMYS